MSPADMPKKRPAWMTPRFPKTLSEAREYILAVKVEDKDKHLIRFTRKEGT